MTTELHPLPDHPAEAMAAIAAMATRQGPAAPTGQALATLRPLGLDAVHLDPQGLLGHWQERNATATLPHCLRQLDASGAVDNVRRAIEQVSGPHVGMWFSDSDIYKSLEAAAWQLGRDPSDAALREFIDTTSELLARAQESDGYLNSYVQSGAGRTRWQDMKTSHELYCAGHLIQAAVACARVGAGGGLFAVAQRLADLAVQRFGADGEEAVCGHPEIETALVELYRTTGRQSYLDLALRFIDLRGKGLLGEDDRFGRAYFQDHMPVREATEVTGHAVRQLYLLAGIVDVAVETGDGGLLEVAQRLWESAFQTKTYLTGGHGSRHFGEAFGDPYELPPDRAYAESCAAIASFHWNWRLLLATGARRYADEMERALYNAIGVATSIDGTRFFYSNPLQLRTGHDGSHEDAPSQRLSWYSCACCPPNLARLMASLQSYVATEDADGVQVHLYAAGTVHTGHGELEVDTRYPWQGQIRVRVHCAATQSWTLALRVPGWCGQSTLTIDGAAVDPVTDAGYVRLTRAWGEDTTVVLDLPMPVRLVRAHPRVDAVRGCVALMRGPLVYSIEQADLPEGAVLEEIVLDTGAAVTAADSGRGSLVPVTLSARGLMQAVEGATDLYGTRPSPPAPQVGVTLTAIPYFHWGNREPGPMRVWIPTAEGVMEQHFGL
ncbi:MAG TPA: beta-L-arabinofuranosidase domain-containing protein [Candidatus Limnocylindrales bacterium]|nr:beta-L-arabinofuranosidase domain-containing protein [Candidatus Limnocylindrales bacterium]